MSKYLIGLFVLVCSGSLSFGQTVFSEEREKFVKEFHKTLSDYGKGDFNEFSKKLLPLQLLESPDFSDNLFRKMVATSNLILEKKLKPYPELYNYVYSMYSLVKSGQSTASVDAWHSTVDNMLDARNVKKFEGFIDLSSTFFSNKILTEQTNYTWYYEGGNFAFDSDGKAFFVLSGGNLICRVVNKNDKEAKKNPYLDSIVIRNTNGVFDPFLKKWEGSEGTIDWGKAGLSEDDYYAEIKEYSVALKSANFNTDSVLFYTPLFEKPILGQLSDRAFISSGSGDAQFPQFTSYDKRLVIKNIKDEMDYVGGFAMKGKNFEGYGTTAIPAVLTIFQDKKTFVVAKSELFVVNDEKIFSKEASFWMQIAQTDSIFHPGATLIYTTKDKKFEIQRSANGIGQSPFTNSYHQLDMYLPKIVWTQDEKVLSFDFTFGMSPDQRIARLESNNYFNGKLYNQIQGLATEHPLVALLNYSYKNDKHLISEGTAATALGKTVDQAKPLLLDLASQGFISYDTETKNITVNQKTINFVEARADKRDYDNIIFTSDLRPKHLNQYSPEEIAKDDFLKAIQSNYNKLNAERNKMTNFGSLDLKSLDLHLVAVDEVTISEAQSVTIFPKNYDVVLKKNRDFDFTGFINAGKLEIDAEVSEFKYNEFKFILTKSNNTSFRVRPMAEKDGNRAIALTSEVNGIIGELLVDDPKNRSGKDKKILGYPKLNVTKDSKIFYNDPEIYRGAYDSTRFYFTVAPFVRDSLDNFEEKSFRLKGELTSAGIFPKFKESVRIMPDYSLGFSTKAEGLGYSFYGTSANYNNKIVLSNSGLQGAGTIKYINATADSKAFAFLPDSTVGFATFENKEELSGIQFPQVIAKEAYITYIPKLNLMKAKSTQKSDLDFFGGQAILKGTAYITPNGMRGEGLMNFLTATLVSNDFAYKAKEITGDTTNFNLRNTNKAEDEENITFKTENVAAKISFADRKGVFVSNGGSSTVSFPINDYICKMDIFNWYMDKDKIDMESKKGSDISFDAGVDLATPNFFSTNPKQDSLMFKAPKATYSIQEKVIYCDDIDYIDIADARISPTDKKLTIRKNAKMDPIPEAKIVANYITKYHTFVKAKVDITGRRAYEATGDYPYFDAKGNLTFIKMDKIGLDTSYQTIANGAVNKEQGFKLSDKFDFYGNLIVRAASPLVQYKGATRLNHSCAKFDRNWMAFDAEIDAAAIQIPVSSEMKNLEGERISAGLVWRDARSTDSIRIYPTFLSALTEKNDPVVMTASGVLQYDYTTKEFQIGPKEKFLNPTEKGNIITLNSETCSMKGNGNVQLGMDFGESKVLAFGDALYDQSTGKTSLDLTISVQMPVEKKPFEDIAPRVQLVPGIAFMDMEEINLEQALREWSQNVEVADKFKSDYIIKGEVKKIPEELAKGITFSGVKLISFDNNEYQEKGLVTTEGSAVLVNVFDKPVFKIVEMDAFFLKTYSGAQSDKFTILFAVTGGKTYFWDYTMAKKDGELRMMSSDSDFKAAVDELKEDKRKSKNFSFGFTDQNVYVAKFKRLLGKEEE